MANCNPIQKRLKKSKQNIMLGVQFTKRNILSLNNKIIIRQNDTTTSPPRLAIYRRSISIRMDIIHLTSKTTIGLAISINNGSRHIQRHAERFC